MRFLFHCHFPGRYSIFSSVKEIAIFFNDSPEIYLEYILFTQTSHTQKQPKAHKLEKENQLTITQSEQYAKNRANRQANEIKSQ